MIQVQEVTKAFAGKKLFESVSTTFPPGRRYGLTGPNGAGKTTFMKILAGDLEPDTGVISRPKHFSVLKQDQYAFEDRKVLDVRSEEHTSELQSPCNLVCRLLLEKKKKYT